MDFNLDKTFNEVELEITTLVILILRMKVKLFSDVAEVYKMHSKFTIL